MCHKNTVKHTNVIIWLINISHCSKHIHKSISNTKYIYNRSTNLTVLYMVVVPRGKLLRLADSLLSVVQVSVTIFFLQRRQPLIAAQECPRPKPSDSRHLHIFISSTSTYLPMSTLHSVNNFHTSHFKCPEVPDTVSYPRRSQVP